jgi:hypothetical protein
MKMIRLILFFGFLFLWNEVFTQGCNDAGLCTFSEFGTSSGNRIERIQNEFTYSFGLGEQQTLVQTIQLDQKITLFDNRFQINLRVPFQYVYGNLAETYGIGDISLGLNYFIPVKRKHRISVFLGSKLPVNDANKTTDGKGLPMVYQTSLGTYDLMGGVNLILGKWHFGLGYQQPFGANENTFSYSEWEENNDALKYFESAYLDRGADLIFRADRYFRFSKNSLKTGLIAIYRVEKDEIFIDGQNVYPEGSNGLTLNLNLEYLVSLKNNDNIRISAAAPLITREYRTDGLTRTFVIAFTYAFGPRPDDILKPVNFGIDN